MTSGRIALLTACLHGLLLLCSEASAQATHTHEYDRRDAVVTDSGFRRFLPAPRTTSADSIRAVPPGGVSTTSHSQILVELVPGDTDPPNPFDLHGVTLLFTPDGRDGYSRQVQSLEWEDHHGEPVADRAPVDLDGFTFDFAGQRWPSFYVSRHGLLTFGGPFTYSYAADGRFDTMRQIAAEFVDRPTISPLYAPVFGGWGDYDDDPRSTRHVAQWPDRVVVTWTARDGRSYERGTPRRPNRFQAVLYADGSVKFNYADVTSGDGIAGLFSNVIQKGDLIASVVDGADAGLPGYLDLLDAAIYASSTNAVILEFTLRDSVPDPPDGEVYSYRLYFDTDEPYWSHPIDWSDEDLMWAVSVEPGGERVAHGPGVQLLPSTDGNRIALLADIGAHDSEISGVAFALAAHFRDDSWVQGDDTGMTFVELSAPHATAHDLSRSDSGSSDRHSEVFHYRGFPDPTQVACRVINALGDEFDFIVLHNEFAVDSQEGGTPVSPYTDIPGTGSPARSFNACGRGRIMAVMQRPVSMHLLVPGSLDAPLGQVTHEFGHAWGAYLSYYKDGRRESLLDDFSCDCHWRFDLHLPAPFPPHGEREAGSHMSVGVPGEGGGGFWRENPDGTFTPGRLHPELSGPSWLDLYTMGLADADEVPDMFILRNLQRVNDGSRSYTADKEVISIEQIIAAEGPREPSVADSQKTFNVAFVYLLEPGKEPADDLLRLHTTFIDQFADRWFRITGGRSRITTTLAENRPGTGGPATRTPETPTTPPTLDVTCHGYDEGATRAYNCIPEASQQHHMRTFVPPVGSACDQGGVAEFPPGRIVFQIRCRDASPGQSAAWSYSGQGSALFVKPVETPRVWVRTSFSGSSVHLSVWCRAPQEHLVVNELLGTSWENDGTSGIYGMAGCREVEVDTEGQDLQWWFTWELAATALTPLRSWEHVTGADSALPAEALQDLATAAEAERLWRRPEHGGMNPWQGASARGALLTLDDDGRTRLDSRIAAGPDDRTYTFDRGPFRSATPDRAPHARSHVSWLRRG